jgi:hypothetical protein
MSMLPTLKNQQIVAETREEEKYNTPKQLPRAEECIAFISHLANFERSARNFLSNNEGGLQSLDG